MLHSEQRVAHADRRTSSRFRQARADHFALPQASPLPSSASSPHKRGSTASPTVRARGRVQARDPVCDGSCHHWRLHLWPRLPRGCRSISLGRFRAVAPSVEGGRKSDRRRTQLRRRRDERVFSGTAACCKQIGCYSFDSSHRWEGAALTPTHHCQLLTVAGSSLPGEKTVLSVLVCTCRVTGLHTSPPVSAKSLLTRLIYLCGRLAKCQEVPQL